MSMQKEELIGMVLEMYDARKEAKEYLEFYVNPDEDGKLVPMRMGICRYYR